MKEILNTKVIVQQRHIDEGIPFDGENCAIALAVKEATGLNYANISPMGIEVGGYLFGANEEISDFIEKFDFLGGCKPFEFALNRLLD